MFPRKGMQHFIEAIAGSTTTGRSSSRATARTVPSFEAHARRVAPQVRFVGFVEPRRCCGRLYESSRILVFPSIQENFPMVLLEAMDAGCAIVTTNAEGCAEVVGDAGLVVPKGDPLGIRAALERLMGDPALMQALSLRARQRAAEHVWPSIVTQYKDVLQAAQIAGVGSAPRGWRSGEGADASQH